MSWNQYNKELKSSLRRKWWLARHQKRMMKYHQTHHQIQIRHHFYHAQIWVISKTEIGYTAPVNVTNVWHLKMIPVQNVTIYTIYDTVMFQNLGLFSMKLFLGVTEKVYHVLPANKIHETKRLSARMILFRVSLIYTLILLSYQW